MEFRAIRTCQYGGKIYRVGHKLIFAGTPEPCANCNGTGKIKDAVCPKCRGTKRSNPPHHFDEVDRNADIKNVQAEAESEMKQIEAIQKEFESIGAAFDRRWKLARLKSELIEAKKERGL